MAWEKVKLGDIAASVQTGPFGSQLHQSDYSEFGTPVVMPKDMIGGKILEDSIARVEEQHVNRLSRHKVNVGDILYARRGDVGKCALVTENEKGWLCGTGCLKVTIDFSKANPKFVFYQLQKPETVGWVEKHAVGATMLNLNTGILESIPLELPKLSEQNKIVGILSAYDNLIENNQKQIKLLEETAQRLYKQWFIDLRYPGHETTKIVDGLPEGWKKCRIDERFKTVLGGTPSRANPNYWNGNIAWINSGEVNNLRIMKASEYITELALEKSATKMMPVHTTVLAITGATLGQVSYTEIETCANQSVVGIIDETELFSMYLYLFVSTNIKSMIGKATGGAQQHINKDIVNEYKIILPEERVIKKMNILASPLFNKIADCYRQIEKLTESRDRLLPKLMSGELEV